MKGKVRRQSLGRRRVNSALGIADDEGSGRGPIVLVADMEGDLACGQTVKKQIDLIPKPEVLGALANIEQDLGFARSASRL